jgi:hypothetical protein
MTPDELPAIEGRVEAFIRWTDPRNTKPFSGSPLQLVSDLRALLKAYQEQRRALEAASPVVPVGVRERVLDELDKAWLHGQRRTSWRRDESADAIMAALRPTDTRREA